MVATALVTKTVTNARFPEATFQLFETDAGGFRWRLRDDDGTVLATSGEAAPTPQAAARRLQRVKHVAPTAGVDAVDSA